VSSVGTQPASRVVAKRQRRERQPTSLSAHGEPFVWLAGGAMATCLAMILGLLALVLWQGGGTFWPGRVVVLDLVDGSRISGEVNVEEASPAESGPNTGDSRPDLDHRSNLYMEVGGLKAGATEKEVV